MPEAGCLVQDLPALHRLVAEPMVLSGGRYFRSSAPPDPSPNQRDAGARPCCHQDRRLTRCQHRSRCRSQIVQRLSEYLHRCSTLLEGGSPFMVWRPRAQDSRSMIMAMPIPPPTHMVSHPRVPSVPRSPLIRVPVIRAPLMPKAMAPPCTLSL